jgi:hypothetical protein
MGRAEVEYMVMEEADMEEAEGVMLHEVWRELALRKKGEVVREVVEVERRVIVVEFEKYD